MAETGNQEGRRMEPSFAVASSIQHWANIGLIASLVVGVISTVLIVWMGNIKEIYLASDISKANERIAESNERAAAAESKAAEAELELINFRKPRLVDSKQAALIIEKIKPFAGTFFDVGHDNLDREQWDFLWQLEPVLPDAGWVHIDWHGGHVFKKPNWPGDHVYGQIGVINVSVELHPQNRDKLLPAAEALVGALNEIGIAAAVDAFNNSSINTGAIHLLVGSKR